MSNFTEELANNTRSAMIGAMLRTVVSDPGRTIGSIIDALETEGDAAGDYLLDHFRDVTIGQLIQAAARAVQEQASKPPERPSRVAKQAPKGLEGLEELEELEGEDEIVEDEGGPEDNLEDEPEIETPKKKTSVRKKAPPSVERPAMVTPSDTKAYQNDIIKFLRKGGHLDENSGASSRDIRSGVGGEPARFRDVIEQLVAVDRVCKYGKAAGTKYYVA